MRFLVNTERGELTVAADVADDFAAVAPWRTVTAQELEQLRGQYPVPRTVSARQIRLWLVGRGISLAAVDAAISAIDDAGQREYLRVEWEYAPYVERTHPWLVPLAIILGIDEDEIDQAFREAAAL